MAYALLATLNDKAHYPTVPPEFALHTGWMVFAFTLALLLWAWTRSESVRRALLALEDPRTMAVLRIGFGIMTIVNFANLAPYWRMLWSDEGLFDLAYAQDRMGRTALRGWSPDEGFFDLWAVANFLWHKPSFLYMHGSPAYVNGHMFALMGVCLLYTLGIGSRVTGVLAWVLISSVYNRNSLYWEGTDTVYRCFWFILLFGKTGHAWSVDNWVRCRWLRRRGLLQDPGDSPEIAAHKRPIYRLVPAWPRYLFMFQLAAIYTSTGWVKTGSVWAHGDALYYALNMDHFYRFEGATQWVSAVLGTNLFRTMTWVTHWWERGFGLLLVGEILRFGLKHRDQAWYQVQQRPWRLWLGRAALVAAYGVLYRTLFEILPFCLKVVGDKPADPRAALAQLHVVFGAIVPSLVLIWFVLGRWPIRLLRGGRSLGRLTRRWPWLRIPEIRIEQASLRRWLLGRRIWLSLGFIFHGFLIGFMNIGMFPFIMLMTYAGYLSGDEFARAFAWLGQRRRGRGPGPGPKVSKRLTAPAQAPAAVPLRGRRFPDALVLMLGLVGAYLVFAKVHREAWVGTATYGWLGSITAIGLLLRLLRPSQTDKFLHQSGPALAYGPLGRALALFAVVWHSSAVGLHLFPPYPIFNTWRTPAKSLFGGWLHGTGTSQSWEMFAPNPPRSNTFMKTIVVEADGTRWDLRNNAYSYRPNPWIINDRMRKMQRRMVGKGKWYLRYWVDFQCREWELRTGEPPEEVEVWALTSRIPKPEVVNIWQPKRLKGRRDSSGAITGGPYDPRKLVVREKLVQTHKCGKDGKLSPEMKERYGLPLSDEERAAYEAEKRHLAKRFENHRTSWDNRNDWGRTDEDKERRRAEAEQRRREREREREAEQPAQPEINIHDDEGQPDQQEGD